MALYAGTLLAFKRLLIKQQQPDEVPLTLTADGASYKRRYAELMELANICASEARVTTAKDVAAELRQMAKEYQRRAANLNGGRTPEIEED